ncbi:MAG: response regulator [Acidimicrobiales bacterium]
MSILVVDDSPIMRKLVIRSLRQAGYGDHEVVEAEDGADALAKIEDQRPKVVLSDWNMPNMNGLELIKALRGKEIQVPFGFITSESTADQKAAAVSAGASFLLSKPFTADELGAQLARFL